MKFQVSQECSKAAASTLQFHYGVINAGKKKYVVTIMASHVAYIVLSIIVQSKSNKLSC